MHETYGKTCGPVEISELDILAAMKHIQGYIDISPGDFKEVFQVAYSHAVQRIMNSLTAADIMTKPVNVVGIEMDLLQTATFLAEKRISGAPVVDSDGRIVGVVSEKDFLAMMGVRKPVSFMQIVVHCLNNKGCMTPVVSNHAIRDIMTTPAITAGRRLRSERFPPCSSTGKSTVSPLLIPAESRSALSPGRTLFTPFFYPDKGRSP